MLYTVETILPHSPQEGILLLFNHSGKRKKHHVALQLLYLLKYTSLECQTKLELSEKDNRVFIHAICDG